MAEFKTGTTLPRLKCQQGGTTQDESAERSYQPGFTRIVLPQTPGVLAELADIRHTLRWFESLPGKEKRDHCHIPLVMYGRAKKATLDIRLLDPTADDEPGNKVNRAVEELLRIYHETTDVSGTQLVFCDVFKSSSSLQMADTEEDGAPASGVPACNQFNLFEEISRKLSQRGIPAQQISLIPADKTKREPIFFALRTGQIRIALGSSERLGVGVNVQHRLAAIHHLDAPNRPTDFEQRNGRIIRQGNLFAQWNRPVEILTYGVEKTLDATSYGRLAMKQKFINQVLTGGATVETMSDIADDDDFSAMNFEQMMATLSGSQTALIFTAKNHELNRMNQQKKAWERGLMNAQTMVEKARRTIAIHTELLPKLSLEAEIMSAKFKNGTKPEGRETEAEQLIESLEFGGKRYTDKSEWADPLERYFSEIKAIARRSSSEQSVRVLTLNGLDLTVKGELTGYDPETNRSIYSIAYRWGLNLTGQINYGWALGTSLRAAIHRTLEAPALAKAQIDRAVKTEQAFTLNLHQPFKKQDQLNELIEQVAALKDAT